MNAKQRAKAKAAEEKAALAGAGPATSSGGSPVEGQPTGSAVAPEGGAPANTAAGGEAEKAARKKRDLGRVVIQVQTRRNNPPEGEAAIVFIDAEKMDLGIKESEPMPTFETSDDAVSFIRARGLAGTFRIAQIKRTFQTKPKVDVEIEDLP